MFTSITGFFSFELFLPFVIGIFLTTQIFVRKLSSLLDTFANFNTKIFLGSVFIFVFSIYGIIFKILKIDLLRLRSNDTYWLKPDSYSSKLDKEY